MRKKIVAANWKMNFTFQQAENFLEEMSSKLDEGVSEDVEVVICPPFLFVELTLDFANDSNFFVGVQNLSAFDKGAFTGEISASMLESMGIDYCIIGHSERRKFFNESHSELKEKVAQALKSKIIPIFCCGELFPERQAGEQFSVVQKQIQESLFDLSKHEFSRIVIAYEPVWAIGTGITATPEQAQEMHAFIRNFINMKYGTEISDNLSILYGGSCTAQNARGIFSQPDVDGGLIGGASLKADEFYQIINSF